MSAIPENGGNPEEPEVSGQLERALPGGPERLARTTILVAAWLITSSCLGLLRDLSLAGLFGASSDTDAFLVAWTIPETVSVLLMEGAMSYLLVPVFVAELTKAGSISRIVRATFLPLLMMLALLTSVAIVAAPLLVDVLAPGIANRPLAIRCFRVAGSTILFMGLSGYLMAALRANHHFVRPASTYVAYNVGILATMYALHHQLGVFSAALGLAIGSALMVAVQIRRFLLLTSLAKLRLVIDRRLLLAAASFFPIAAYSLGRQSQVFVERIVGSLLDPGSISYMNYASKVAQMPTLLVMAAATVAFPSLARMSADRPALRTRVNQELRRVIVLIMPAITFVLVFAGPCVRLLFERGAFGAADTAATVGVMRIYCLGLLGQVLVGVGTMVSFSGRNPSWAPARSVIAGLIVTILLDVSLARSMGVNALAVGNAAGITVSAFLIWWGIHRRVVSYNALAAMRLTVALAPMSLGAAAVAWLLCHLLPSDAAVQVLAGGTLTLGAFLLVTTGAGVQESKEVAQAVGRACRQAGDKLRRAPR
jgi:putative peptidoglycan lipid II flippase